MEVSTAVPYFRKQKASTMKCVLFRTVPYEMFC